MVTGPRVKLVLQRIGGWKKKYAACCAHLHKALIFFQSPKPSHASLSPTLLIRLMTLLDISIALLVFHHERRSQHFQSLRPTGTQLGEAGNELEEPGDLSLGFRET